MEERKDGRFPLHAVLNNLEQVKSYGVSTDAEKIVFYLALKGCLRSAEVEAESEVPLSFMQPKAGRIDQHLMNADCR